MNSERIDALYVNAEQAIYELECLDETDKNLAQRRESLEVLLAQLKSEEGAAAERRKDANHSLKCVKGDLEKARTDYIQEQERAARGFEARAKRLDLFLEENAPGAHDAEHDSEQP